MRIGLVKEIKDKENRVALTPAGAGQLVAEGHHVSVEENVGVGSSFSNDEYLSAGAEIVSTIAAWDNDLVIKIKEPLEQEYQYMNENILFTYFHLAGAPVALTDALIKAKTSAIAYETVEDDQGRLPLLAPMSAVAGNVAANVGGYYLAKFNGGKGVQLGSVMGERHGKVMVIGNGIVAIQAVRRHWPDLPSIDLPARGYRQRWNSGGNRVILRCHMDKFLDGTWEKFEQWIRYTNVLRFR